MKKIISLLLVVFLSWSIVLTSPAVAATSSGAKIFNANCASCHAGGRNLVQKQKTLKKDALEKYGMYSLDAIAKQVTYGKNAMPAFRGRLNPQQIEDVSAYVLAQADNNWK
jgi:cytochrome c6